MHVPSFLSVIDKIFRVFLFKIFKNDTIPHNNNDTAVLGIIEAFKSLLLLIKCCN